MPPIWLSKAASWAALSANVIRHAEVPNGITKRDLDVIARLEDRFFLNTYVSEAFGVSPILCVRSPEKRCGKTRNLEVLSCVVHRPLLTANITVAALYRTNAFVLRCIGKHQKPKLSSVWCPKAIALIGRLPATLEDRSIVTSLRRR